MKNLVTLFVFFLLSFLSFVPSYAPAQETSNEVRKVTEKVEPQYPSLARSMNIRGTVKVDVVVAPNGAVKSVEVKGGHPLLVQAAQMAVRQWRWQPASHETHEVIEFRFNP
ncbi:MAG: energy transducer TonB [Candidatus Sulfotelmatobacter sp.]